jgi:hypothetical protein
VDTGDEQTKRRRKRADRAAFNFHAIHGFGTTSTQYSVIRSERNLFTQAGAPRPVTFSLHESSRSFSIRIAYGI